MYTPATSSEETLHFPLTLRMKLMALAPQFYVSDKSNRPIAYIKQKLFKLKEDIRVFADEQQNRLLYSIKADRIIDFNASYSLSDAQTGQALGAMPGRLPERLPPGWREPPPAAQPLFPGRVTHCQACG